MSQLVTYLLASLFEVKVVRDVEQPSSGVQGVVSLDSVLVLLSLVLLVHCLHRMVEQTLRVSI